jgi:hypothetical protein
MPRDSMVPTLQFHGIGRCRQSAFVHGHRTSPRKRHHTRCPRRSLQRKGQSLSADRPFYAKESKTSLQTAFGRRQSTEDRRDAPGCAQYSC